jgi:hypothetical protein
VVKHWLCSGGNMSADDDPQWRDLGRAERDGLEQINAVLSSWDGANVIVLGSGLTFRHLRVDLWKPGHETQLAVLCAPPRYYYGPLQWVNARVRVVAVSPEQRVPFAEEFELRDELAAVRLVCGDVHLNEEPAISWRRSAKAT